MFLVMKWCIAWVSVLTFLTLEMKPSLAEDFVPEKHKNWNKLDHVTCGFSIFNKIVGGKEAELGEFPYMTLVGFAVGNISVAHVCGGAILSKYYILTAAHCFDYDMELVKRTVVSAGGHHRLSARDCLGVQCSAPGQLRPARRISVHPNYTVYPDATALNDIAIIELQTPLEYNQYVRPVCLPNSAVMKMDLGGYTAYLAGWGKFELGGEGRSSGVLQKVKLTILNDATCGEKYNANLKKQVCAGGRLGQSACGGDSGGPLAIKLRDPDRMSRHYVIGLLSYGPKHCGRYPHPDFYTRVSAFQEFILNQIEKF